MRRGGWANTRLESRGGPPGGIQWRQPALGVQQATPLPGRAAHAALRPALPHRRPMAGQLRPFTSVSCGACSRMWCLAVAGFYSLNQSYEAACA